MRWDGFAEPKGIIRQRAITRGEIHMKAEFMRQALELAIDQMRQDEGGPFGAVVVRDGSVVSRGWNQVTSRHDPTAHAEVMAIREACRVLRTFRLDDCELYASCEPCPMCLGAIYWSRISRVYYAATREDAAAAGFDDAWIYEEIPRPLEQRRIKFERLLAQEAVLPFAAWKAKKDKIGY